MTIMKPIFLVTCFLLGSLPCELAKYTEANRLGRVQAISPGLGSHTTAKMGNALKERIGGCRIKAVEGGQLLKDDGVEKLRIPTSLNKRTEYPTLLQSPDETLFRKIEIDGILPSPENIGVIYNSTDGGKTWSRFDKGIPQDATVSSFLTTHDRIYASTDYHGIYTISAGRNEWKRIDENLPEKVDINAIAASGKLLFIGTLRHGVMVSADNGKSWSDASLHVKSSIRCLYANGKMLLAGTDDGVYKSLDHGSSWTHVWKGVQVNGFAELKNEVYAALMNGAIRTRDHGTTWSYIYRPHTLHDISTDGESIYAMTLGGGLKKSSDSGLTWENINEGLGTANFYTFDLKVFANKIYAAQWHGIYVSDNWGEHWRMIKNGLPDSTAFTTLEATNNGLIAGIGLRKN